MQAYPPRLSCVKQSFTSLTEGGRGAKVLHIPPAASVAGREAASWAAFAYLEARIRTNVYIDGFNFYYGALRKTPYRWVNVRKLCELLLPKNTVAEIKYFTALVSARPNDLTSRRVNSFICERCALCRASRSISAIS